MADLETQESFTALNKAKGLDNLVNGYLEYSREVIKNRAIPDIYDGLKPVQRIILVIAKKLKADKNKVKSGQLVGAILKYYGHGDSSVYDALVRLVDSNGTQNVPFFEGKGSFGKSYSDESAAAMRYTGVLLKDYMNEYFRDPDGVDTVTTEDGLELPGHLPVPFPSVLSNESSGAAVGLSTKIPSFNFEDLTKLVDEYINTGKLHTVIAPDFSTGGYVVNNLKEFKRIMSTGKGSIKMRAKVVINGQNLVIEELPYGVNVQKITKELNKLTGADGDTVEIDFIKDYNDFSDNKGLNYTITMKKGVDAERALAVLYGKTSLQTTFHSNMMFVQDGTPVSLGVNAVIRAWVKWRKKVISRQAKSDLQAVLQELEYIEIFLWLLKNPEDVNQIMTLISDNKAAEAKNLLYDKYNATPEIAKWVLNRSISQFNREGKYKIRFDTLKEEKERLVEIKNHPETQILADMNSLRANPELNRPRKSEISNVDFNFVRKEEEQEKIEDVYYVIKNGFIQKLRNSPYMTDGVDFVLKGKSNDVIVCVDTNAHLLRVYGEELPYNLQSERGTYIPRYCGFIEEDQFIMWATIAKTNNEFLLMYSDGYTGYLDTTKYARENINQRSRLQSLGINQRTDLLLDIVDYRPEDYLVIKQVTTRTSKLGLIKIKDIKKRNQQARSKVFAATDTTNWGIFTEKELQNQMFPITDYLVTDKDKKLKDYDGDFPLHKEDME